MKKGADLREAWIGLVCAAAFVFLFYISGDSLAPSRTVASRGMLFLTGAVALALAVSIFLVEWFGFAGREVRKVRLAARDFLFLLSLSLALLLSAKIVTVYLPDVRGIAELVPPRALLYLVPVTGFAMVVRTLLNSEVALLFTVAASVLAGATGAGGKWSALLYLLICGTAGASRARRVQERRQMILAGIYAAPACAAGAAALELAFHGPSKAWIAGLFGLANGVSAGFVALAILPLAEWVFGYASDIRLVELSSTNHPLLRRLMEEAPGTYHHSTMVATLAERGAVAVGANPVLCRTAALYHDVGKIEMPRYFTENQAGRGNVHDLLSPGMSRLVILSHVREGVRLVRKHRLGDRVEEIVAGHHGTSLLYFFVDKARDLIRERRADEETFRYPGPKPRSREAAIVMLADAAEAVCRSLRTSSPREVEEAVNRVVERIWQDGQLNDSDLSLRDLYEVTKAFSRVLPALAHGRIDYPSVKGIPSGREGAK